jgi:hypothetical protein
MTKHKVTIEELNGMSVYEAQEYCDSKKIETPPYPKKPFLSKEKKNDVKAVEEHLKNLKQYDIEKKTYDYAVSEIAPINSEIEEVFLEYMKERAGLNTVPEQYRDKVYSFAYQLGHSSGYGEVSNYLMDLVDIFR